MTKIPTAFISYSWDSPAHKIWVRDLADRLTREGIRITFDQRDAAPGEDLPLFMETAVRENDFVLMVCTPGYKSRYDKRVGAGGYEAALIQAEAYIHGKARKFIPVLSQGEWEDVAPSAVLGKYYIDLHNGVEYENNYQKLLSHLLGRQLDARSKLIVLLPGYRPSLLIRRAAYLDRLRDALVAKPGNCLLTGEPGSGKTTLGLMFAFESKDKFDAVVHQICGQRPAETIVTELADKLRQELGENITQLPPEQKIAKIKKWLCARRSLLVLDDVHDKTLQFQNLIPGHPASVLFTARMKSLPWVTIEDSLEVEPFTREECEQAFRKHLPAEVVIRYKDDLLHFAERMERLPIAVMVGADLLRCEVKPVDMAATGIVLEELRNELHDVDDLFQRAIEGQGKIERRLLRAAAVCTPEGFWLPLVFKIAGLQTDLGEVGARNLVNASLMQRLDPKRPRFKLHALLREKLRTMESLRRTEEAYIQALERLFQDWEMRWQECRECLPEIIPAIEWLLCKRENDRAWDLSFRAFVTAQRIGELDTALDIEQCIERARPRSNDLESKRWLQASYGNQAVVLRRWGRLEEALDLLERTEAICVKLHKQDLLQSCYANRALILRLWGRLEEALELHKKQERICQELDIKDSLQISYANQANILHVWGRHEEALVLHKKEEVICLELNNWDSLQRSYGNQAVILQKSGCLEEALTLHQKEEAIFNTLGSQDSLHRSYGNQELVLKAWRQLEEARTLLKKQEAICLELGNQDSLQCTYANQELILEAWRRLEEVRDLLKKQEAICWELVNQRSLHRSDGDQELIFEAWQRLGEAQALLKKQEAVCLRLGNKDSLQTRSGIQTLIFKLEERLAVAEDLLKKKEAICLRLGNEASLGYCYWNWGLLAREQADRDTEKHQLHRALAIFTKLKMPRERDAVHHEFKVSDNTLRRLAAVYLGMGGKKVTY